MSADHNLIYYCKTTGKEYKGRKLAMGQRVSLINPDTCEKISLSQGKLRELFKGHKDNKWAHKSKESKQSFYKSFSGSKAYRDYLNGVA